jgi:hypothetical protein
LRLLLKLITTHANLAHKPKRSKCDYFDRDLERFSLEVASLVMVRAIRIVFTPRVESKHLARLQVTQVATALPF